MKIAVEGCAHGELDNIYDSILSLEKQENVKVDLLICCGDFQSSRNEEDLGCMAVPPKYNHLRTFYRYYSGEKKAPILTIFIGGNHEASNYLQELPYGGWVAPNIFYLGYAGVINIGGIRIAGISGIYKSRDYMKGHYEKTPYTDESKRTVYHIRNLEVFRLKQLSQPIDIFLSHDWPAGIFKYGNVQQLLRYKPYFKEDIESQKLGSPPCQELLQLLKPSYWFSAHLHCKFAALVSHADDTCTKFLALDKCLPNKRFLQFIDIPHGTNKSMEIHYDLEWLAVLNLTNHLLSMKNQNNYMPGPNGNERWNFTPTKEDMNYIHERFGNDLKVPNNFVKTAKPYNNSSPLKITKQPSAKLNPQTKMFCAKLGIDDPIEVLLKISGADLDSSQETDETSDQSFLEDSEHSSDLNSSDSIQISPLQRLTLNLPKPKDDTMRNIDFDSMPENSIIGKIQGSPEQTVDMIVENNTQSLESDSKITSIKKIRRRNANIYEGGND